MDPPRDLGYYSGYQSNTYSHNHHRSAPSTPQHHPHTYDPSAADHYGTWSNGLRSAYSQADDIHGSSASSTSTVVNDDDFADQTLRNDLLLAADSVTNAMSSLVKELNGPDQNESDGRIMKPLGLKNGPTGRPLH